jgi:hypothetical protein
VGDEQEGEEEEEEERPAVDLEDGWMLELSDKQLLKILAQVSLDMAIRLPI